MFYQKRNQKRMIKDSFDNLPTGIIFAKTNGVILLANSLMYDLYCQLSDGALQSAHAFWHSLTVANDKVKLLENATMPVLQFADDKVYRFSKRNIEIEHNRILQIEAVDISELYQLKQTHLQKHDQLVSLRHKMVETKATLENVTRQEEMLDAKIKIHNTMGMGLATIRRHLATGQGDLSKALTIWRRSIELLVNSDSFVQMGLFESLQQAAQSIGIAIDIVGQWPENRQDIEKVLIGVGRECLINAYKHGSAKRLKISIVDRMTDYQIVFSNDGQTSQQSIQPGGGFTSIQKTLEAVGGSFEVVQMPQFALVLSVPKDY